MQVGRPGQILHLSRTAVCQHARTSVQLKRTLGLLKRVAIRVGGTIQRLEELDAEEEGSLVIACLAPARRP